MSPAAIFLDTETSFPFSVNFYLEEIVGRFVSVSFGIAVSMFYAGDFYIDETVNSSLTFSFETHISRKHVLWVSSKLFSPGFSSLKAYRSKTLTYFNFARNTVKKKDFGTSCCHNNVLYKERTAGRTVVSIFYVFPSINFGILKTYSVRSKIIWKNATDQYSEFCWEGHESNWEIWE